MKKRVLAMIMAGGKGNRLYPLTKERAKPAVPFGGRYRIIDFVLSNFINSDIYSIYVLTQFKAQSLLQHIENTWNLGNVMDEYFVTSVPAQMRSNESWYEGTADAIYQNINLIKNFSPDIVAIFGADHIYRMNIRQMLNFHERVEAKVTIAALPIKCDQASQYGILKTDEYQRVTNFEEKPRAPHFLPYDPQFCLASMGNYLFDTQLLLEKLEEDRYQNSTHDFGKDIFPKLYQNHGVYAYDFSHNHCSDTVAKQGYWRDVGTILEYWKANMELKSENPIFDLYNKEWPIHTSSCASPPTRFINGGNGIDSLISEGCTIAGTVKNSVLGCNVIVHNNAYIENSIIMDEVEIESDCIIRKAIIDKKAKILKGTQIGCNVQMNACNGYYIDESGIVVIRANEVVPYQKDALALKNAIS